MEKLGQILRDLADLAIMVSDYRMGKLTDIEYRARCEQVMKEIEEAFPPPAA